MRWWLDLCDSLLWWEIGKTALEEKQRYNRSAYYYRNKQKI